ncbi:hypothetical protein SteCoe_3041 [Stentor coeruleus]|uniref:rRNA methyltransferase 2, mitochondrial n=1 Tax=Stentor coeruleus TaxID=5963 RepID=A0A1R2CXX2_9CILI|nr:hypothetical protein SteCoe_3041 [Stentor coeruleus]
MSVMKTLIRCFSRNWAYRPPKDEKIKFTERFRSRNAFKLLELNERYGFLKKGMRVLDLGCNPGGWAEVAVQAVGANKDNVLVWGVDEKSTIGLDGFEFIQGDVSTEGCKNQILETIKSPVDIILSDLTCSTIHDQDIDCEANYSLCLDSLSIANVILKRGGTALMRMIFGLEEPRHFETIKKYFSEVERVKSNYSSKYAHEFYYFAKGWKLKEIEETEIGKEDLKKLAEQVFASGLKLDPHIEGLLRKEVGEINKESSQYAYLKDEDEEFDHFVKTRGSPSFNIEIPEKIEDIKDIVKKWDEEKKEKIYNEDENQKDEEEYNDKVDIDTRKMIDEMMMDKSELVERQMHEDFEKLDEEQFGDKYGGLIDDSQYEETRKERVSKFSKGNKATTHEFDYWAEAKKDTELWDN